MKKGKIILGVVLGILVLGIAICFIFLNDTIPVLRSSSFGINTKWARLYFKELKSGDYKKEIEGIDRAKAKKISFIGNDNGKDPAMVLTYELDNKEMYFIFAIGWNGNVFYTNARNKNNFKLYYDDIMGEFNYFLSWYHEKEKYYEYDSLTNFTDYNSIWRMYYAYDNGNFVIHSAPQIENKKYTNKKVNEFLIQIDYEPSATFEYSFDDEDYVIKRKLKEAVSKYQPIEEIYTYDDKDTYIKKIKENEKKADNDRKKAATTKSSSSSSKSSQSSKNCENPCNCIERKKCPSGWTLICSMEWCEKKITSISKSSCNDSIAKKYGTPAKDATSWSTYENACYVVIEAKK